MTQQDTITTHHAAPADTARAAKAPQQPSGPPTVKQILSWLPKDATPAQQDSAVQAHIKVAPIHWSGQPDTLHLPGHGKGRSLRDVSLPQYYRESFFEGKPCFDPNLFGGRLGVAGDPVPYSVAGDNLITSLLLACFVLAMVAFSQSRNFILRQTKNFFRVQRDNTTVITETSSELRFQFFLILQTCLVGALTYFLYVLHFVTDTFTTDQYIVIGIYTAAFAAYFLLKAAVSFCVHWVFFDKKRNEQWIKSNLFLVSAEGVFLFPLVLLQTYFGLPLQTSIICCSVVVIFFKILSFYKSYLIFFRRNGVFLQNILYFCALEIMPMGALWGFLGYITSYLEVNF